MSSGSCKFSNAAASVTAPTFFPPRSYYRHPNHFRSSSYVPTGTRVNPLNESHKAHSSALNKSAASPGGNFDRLKFSCPPPPSSAPLDGSCLSSAKMDPSTGSSTATATATRTETVDNKPAVPTSTSKPVIATTTTGDTSKATRVEVNGETVRSLASNLETSLSLNSGALSSSSGSNGASYKSCQSCHDTSTIDNANNNSISNISSEASHPVTLSHANSCSDSSKSLNVPKFGTPVPNRVFVGGIPLDATEYDVRQLFAQYGNISSVKIISDRAGVSRGYGFVTYDSEEDAQKVIKEAENLIIKHRRLNVSTAVMKHQQSSFGFDPRMIPNGSFIYPQLPFNSAANFPQQFYPENFHGICPASAEGLPLYQLAGMNGHSFMSANCPSFLSQSTANYLNQTAAAASAFSAPYQSPGYIYPGITTGPTPSLPMASQHSLYQSQQAAAAANQAHLLATTSLPNAFHAYSPAACGAQQAATANSNSAALQAMRGNGYPLPPSHQHSSSGQTSQSMNMNASSSQQQPQQQYIQFSPSTTSPAMSHPAMHLASTMPLHPHHQSHLASLQLNHQVSHEMANSNSAVASSNLSPGAGTQLNAALLHHAHHSHPAHQASSMAYANYQNNLAAAAAAAHYLKADGSGMEMLDNVSAGIMNGTTNSSTGLASLPTTVHLTSNGYGMPQMMEVIWPSSHLPNAAAYAPLHLSNTSNGPSYATNSTTGNSKPHQAPLPPSNNRSISSVPASSSNSNSNNAYPKSSHNNAASLPNGHSSSNSSSSVSAVPVGSSATAAPVGQNSASSTSNPSNTTVSSKEKAANPRHGASSYGPSHKKMYNGTGNVSSNNSSHTNSYNSSAKSKALNGNVANGSARYPLNSVDSLGEPSGNEPPLATAAAATSYSGPTPKQQYSKQPSVASAAAIVSPSSVNSRANGGANGVSGSSPQAFVTKTVNGVQIYALASNGDVNGPLDATTNGPVTSPPLELQ